jgi:ubiquinone/menaquinone biosynthesis C-methylase UbiE
MGDARRSFVPAAGHDWLLPFYDPLQRLLGGETAHRQLIARADIPADARILDIGCGTGSLVVLIKRLHPEAEVVGLDPDPKALARARRKAERARVAVQLDQGFSDDLPYPAASFDRVFSSFMFHHLGSDEKKKTLSEVQRVLRPAGSLHLLDFGGSEARSGGWLARLLHRSDHLRDNFEGRIPALMCAAGFAAPEEVAHRATVFGRVASYHAALRGSESGVA